MTGGREEREREKNDIKAGKVGEEQNIGMHKEPSGHGAATRLTQCSILA